MKQVPFWELTFSFSRLAGYVIAAWKVTPQNSLRSKGTSTSAIKKTLPFWPPLVPHPSVSIPCLRQRCRGQGHGGRVKAQGRLPELVMVRRHSMPNLTGWKLRPSLKKVCCDLCIYTPEDWHRTWTWWFGKWFSFSRGVFSGSMLIFGGVDLQMVQCNTPLPRKWWKMPSRF